MPRRARGSSCRPGRMSAAPGCRLALRNEKADQASNRTALTREAKLVTVWTAEKQSEGTPEQGSAPSAAPLLSIPARSCRLSLNGAKHAVAAAPNDAWSWEALWIWNIADELFPDATIDLFHAKQHLWSKEIYGDLAEAWAKKQCDALEDGQEVIAVLRKHGAAGDPERNRARMQRFRAQGLSSGVVEAGCKRTVGSRRGGMWWTVGCGRRAPVFHAQWALRGFPGAAGGITNLTYTPFFSLWSSSSWALS